MADYLDDLETKGLPFVSLYGMTVFASDKVEKGSIVMNPEDIEMLKDPEAHREKQETEMKKVSEYFQEKLGTFSSWEPWKK